MQFKINRKITLKHVWFLYRDRCLQNCTPHGNSCNIIARVEFRSCWHVIAPPITSRQPRKWPNDSSETVSLVFSNPTWYSKPCIPREIFPLVPLSTRLTFFSQKEPVVSRGDNLHFLNITNLVLWVMATCPVPLAPQPSVTHPNEFSVLLGGGGKVFCFFSSLEARLCKTWGNNWAPLKNVKNFRRWWWCGPYRANWKPLKMS